MWITSTTGFVSIVEKPSDRGAGTLTVRARRAADLAFWAALCSDATQIAEIPKTDYRYRLQAPADQVAAAMSSLILGIQYDNFKDAVRDSGQTDRLSIYHNVWWDLLELQRPPSGGSGCGRLLRAVGLEPGETISWEPLDSFTPEDLGEAEDDGVEYDADRGGVEALWAYCDRLRDRTEGPDATRSSAGGRHLPVPLCDLPERGAAPPELTQTDNAD